MGLSAYGLGFGVAKSRRMRVASAAEVSTMLKTASVASLVFLVIVGVATAQDKQQKKYDAPPPMTIDPNKQYTATIETEKGKIVLDLFPKEAPGTVNNFVFLARDGYYNGLIFHRVIPDFMIQGGDPTGTGAGGPGYTIKDEVKDNPHKHERGTLSMAKTQAPDSGGSQFFITHVPTPHLDGIHTVFGKVREGQDVVDKIAKGDVMKTITIEEK
jgi:peptidyl-prolyl cis-trans isomerase B (cyclophilin B)